MSTKYIHVRRQEAGQLQPTGGVTIAWKDDVANKAIVAGFSVVSKRDVYNRKVGCRLADYHLENSETSPYAVSIPYADVLENMQKATENLIGHFFSKALMPSARAQVTTGATSALAAAVDAGIRNVVNEGTIEAFVRSEVEEKIKTFKSTLDLLPHSTLPVGLVPVPQKKSFKKFTKAERDQAFRDGRLDDLLKS